MTRVAVMASSPAARARLDALVSTRPGLSLVSDRSLAAGDPGIGGADVLLVEAGPRRLEAAIESIGGLPGVPVVLLARSDQVRGPSARLVRAGVRAVLPEAASAHEIGAAVEAAASGLVVLHPSSVPALAARRASTRSQPGGPGAERLTPRELEILEMMAEGVGNRVISRRLGISSHTVKSHIASVLDKLGARSRTGAVAVALRLGLLMV